MQEINELKDSFVDNLLPLKIYLFGSMAKEKEMRIVTLIFTL